MKKLFKAIHDKDLETVRALLEADPALIACVAKQPPKKDDGQSPLQVALKSGALRIAEELLDRGADVNFMEDPACCNAWRAPALHDAINAAVMCSRWNTNGPDGLKVFSTQKRADKAYEILSRMIRLGADVNAPDSYGNSPLWRFCMQATQILPAYDRAAQALKSDRLLTPELQGDLARIILLLKDSGADLDYVAPNTGKSPRDFYARGPVADLLAL